MVKILKILIVLVLFISFVPKVYAERQRVTKFIAEIKDEGIYKKVYFVYDCEKTSSIYNEPNLYNATIEIVYEKAISPVGTHNFYIGLNYYLELNCDTKKFNVSAENIIYRDGGVGCSKLSSKPTDFSYFPFLSKYLYDACKDNSGNVAPPPD
ncbi:MAG TPA: hypothetical protein DEP28_03255 [Bacteroidetes bacterium]|nr:hypothetical protein [Bacteroidota bacterium]HCN36482.1 hypothetical protein [Bacteroidota bacterium]